VSTTTSIEAPAGRTILRCEGLVVGWQGVALLPPIDVALERGSLLAVVGRNGSGKTTWFRTVLGLVPPIAGRVVLETPRPRLAYVPQSLEVDPALPLRAREVVAWGRLDGASWWKTLPSRADRETAARALEEAGASDLAERRFHDLSKGERQRVLFARMLAREPDLALLDEPTSAMDAVAERDAVHLLERLARRRGTSIVLVSHSVDVAAHHADRILLLDRVAREITLGPRDEVLASEAYLRHSGLGAPCAEPHDD
jgi:zinc transport system ATP-binding protein